MTKPRKKANPMLQRTQERVAQKPLASTPAATPAREGVVRTTIYLPRHLHEHWGIEAKKARTTLSEAVRQALTDRFGEPE
ncbi:hypothetical protein DM785_02395 [Deinococcus actinosclerus]|nr:hypothetical protein DM785_02395 [Deinococcus actinosclerus]